jgi:hypothetical protein
LFSFGLLNRPSAANIKNIPKNNRTFAPKLTRIKS